MSNEVAHITKYHDDAKPVHPEVAPVKHTEQELAALHLQQEASAHKHEHLEDGSVVAVVKFCFVFPTVDHGINIVPLYHVTEHGHHEHSTHELLQYFSKPQDVVKGGFFISAEGKSWSNETTIDEPWMIESYFKALIPILKKKETTGTAYPFWPQSSKGQEDATEAKVLMHVVPEHETALVLEHEDHHCCIKVMTRSARVSLKHFAAALVHEGDALLKLVQSLDAQVLGETMKKFPNPERLHGYLEECKALL